MDCKREDLSTSRIHTVHSKARSDPSTFQDGQRAGRSITLHKPVSGTSSAPVRLLGPRGAAR